jgi:hypothetical protein
MPDYVDYIIDGEGNQGNGNGYHRNGYNQLNGDWALFYKVTSYFVRHIRYEDRQDWLHDTMLEMAKVKAKYDQIGKPLTEAGLIRVACYERAKYWRAHFKRIRGMDCSRCSKAQRLQCRKDWLYSDCPKAIKIDSLDRLVEDGNGDSTPLHELIADDNAVDIVARLDARRILQGYPRRFVQLAYKRYAGYPLNNTERMYYFRQLKKVQKTLV